MVALLAVLLTLLIGGVMWQDGHPAIIDRPGPHPFWDRHSIWHFLGSLALAFVICLFDGGRAAVLATFFTGLFVEIAQAHPHDGLGGHFGIEDLVVDLLGIAAGVLLCAAL